ncbi:hypothetical protein ACHQM5_014488 [Ranunculus cassubicifolius]
MEKKPLTSAARPWTNKILLSLYGALTDFSRRSDGTVNRFLLNLLIPTINPPSKPVNGLRISDIVVHSGRNLWFRLFVPTEISIETKLPVVAFFHGGWFTFLSADTKQYDSLCRRLALEIPAVIVSVNYRLSPEFKCPAAYDDGFDCLKFIDRKSFDEFPENADLSKLFLAGGTAGGNIAHNVARRVAEREGEFSELKVIGLIAIQPLFGGVERTESEIELNGVKFTSFERSDWHWKAFLPEGADRDHEAANVFGPKATDISNLRGFPRTLLFIGGLDRLKDWQKRYYLGLKRCGKEVKLVEYPNGVYAFYAFPELPEASLFLSEVKDFIHSNCACNSNSGP